jgi:hypothetical protein
MTHNYTEDQLVEQSAIGLFVMLGWQTVSALPLIRFNPYFTIFNYFTIR